MARSQMHVFAPSQQFPTSPVCKSAGRNLLSSFCLLILLLTGIVHAAQEDSLPGWLTESERQWLREHPAITIGPDPYYPPIEFFDESGHFSGIAADYLKEIESMLGVRFTTIRLPNWDEVIAKTKSRDIDILSAVGETPSRKGYLAFTSAYLTLPAVILTRKQMIQDTSMAELEGKRVAATKGYAVTEFIKTNYPNIDLIEVNSIEEGLTRLSVGDLDAMICLNAPALYYIEKNGIVNLHIAGRPGFTLKIAFAIRSDWPMLARIMQKSLNAIPDSKVREIQAKWMNPDLLEHWQPSQNQILWAVVAFMLTTLLIAFSWNRSLKSKVSKKTRELAKHMKALELIRQETYVSEQRLRSIFNSADIALFIHANDGTIIDVNDKALSMYGLRREDIKNVSVANDLSASDCNFDQIPTYWEKALNGTSQRFPWRGKRFDNGAEFPIEICLTKLKITEKDIILASISDKSTDQMAQNERRFLLEETTPVITSYLKSLSDEIDNILATCPSAASNEKAICHSLSAPFKAFDNYLEDYIDCALISYKSRAVELDTVDLAALCSHMIELAPKGQPPKAINPDLALDLKTLCDKALVLADPLRLKALIKHLLQLALIHAKSDTVISLVIDEQPIKQDNPTEDAANIAVKLIITYYGDTFTSNQNLSTDLNEEITAFRHRQSAYSLYMMSQTLAESMGATLTVSSTTNVVTTFKLLFVAATKDQ
jgi:PAS domain S-box-containing protein